MVSIEAGSCMATISGQGLAAEVEAEWDGTIVVEETCKKWRLTEGMGLKSISEKISVEQEVPEPVGIRETVQKPRMVGFPMVIE